METIIIIIVAIAQMLGVSQGIIDTYVNEYTEPQYTIVKYEAPPILYIGQTQK